MNDFIEVNKDIFDIEEHRIKMNVPPQAEFYGFTLINPKNNQFVSKLVVGQKCTAIFMTPKQMKNLLLRMFSYALFWKLPLICPYSLNKFYCL